MAHVSIAVKELAAKTIKLIFALSFFWCLTSDASSTFMNAVDPCSNFSGHVNPPLPIIVGYTITEVTEQCEARCNARPDVECTILGLNNTYFNGTSYGVGVNRTTFSMDVEKKRIDVNTGEVTLVDVNTYIAAYEYSCKEGYVQNGGEGTSIYYVGCRAECQPPTTYNEDTGLCEKIPECQPPTAYSGATGLCEKECPADKPWDDTARDCVAPPEPQNCSNEAGNPINFFTGHKLQRESVFEANGDFPLTFSWLYNSFGNHRKTGAGYSVGSKILEGSGIALVGETMLHTELPLTDGAQRISLPLDNDPTANYQGNVIEHWRHNHSYFLAHYTLPDGTTSRLIAYRPSGSDLHFVEESGEFVALANRNWRLTKELDANSEQIGWILRVDGRIERYDTAGRILRVENEQGQGISYTYDESGVRQTAIADDNGNSISLAYADEKLTQITRNDGAVYQFAYNDNGLLQSIAFPGSATSQRVFRYEDSRFPNALTGVTDEAGKAYSTFAYDDQGRAIRTEHNSGAESVDVAYVDENTRRLTNALGKQTTYHYADVNGVKRITSIDGEASANCAASSKAYTYDSNGFVASETDWEGNVTTYTRDNLGRELTRTEGAGTASEQVITTEWHATLNQPLKVTSPEIETIYSYDADGHLNNIRTVKNEL